MTDIYAVPGETLTGIANAIRSKTGSDEQMTVSAMAAAIEGISGGGALVKEFEIIPEADFKLDNNTSLFIETGIDKIPSIIFGYITNLDEWRQSIVDYPSYYTLVGFCFLRINNCPIRQNLSTVVKADNPGEFSWASYVTLGDGELYFPMSVPNSRAYAMSTSLQAIFPNRVEAGIIRLPRMTNTVYCRKGLKYKILCVYDLFD